MKRIILVVLSLFVTACVSIKEVPQGGYKVAGAYEVQLGHTWAEMPKSTIPMVIGSLLTIDGPQLNRLHLVGGLSEGDSIVKAQSKEQRVPEYNPGMSTTELAEFVIDSIVAYGYENVEAKSMRPSSFGGVEGLRFEIEAATPAGLYISGTALIGLKDEELNLILYLAPQQYYYGLRAPEVESIMKSVVLL